MNFGVGFNFGEGTGGTSILDCKFEGSLYGAITLSDVVERIGERIGGFGGDTRYENYTPGRSIYAKSDPLDTGSVSWLPT